MDVIKKFPEDMDARTAYKLMKSPEVKKMSEAERSILQVDPSTTARTRKQEK